MTHDGHEREAGILSGEGAVDAVGATTALQYTFGRERPASGNSAGEFWRKGTSFPSDHATAAWAVASVVAHEYPGPLTKLFVYGLASAVSLSRVTGEKHFPTDVLVGSAIGWLVGQHVYRAHHDPELGGSSWETFSEARAEQGGRNFKNAGSPHVPLDSWIYSAIDRLIALGYIHSAFQDVRRSGAGGRRKHGGGRTSSRGWRLALHGARKRISKRVFRSGRRRPTTIASTGIALCGRDRNQRAAVERQLSFRPDDHQQLWSPVSAGIQHLRGFFGLWNDGPLHGLHPRRVPGRSFGPGLPSRGSRGGGHCGPNSPAARGACPGRKAVPAPGHVYLR